MAWTDRRNIRLIVEHAVNNGEPVFLTEEQWDEVFSVWGPSNPDLSQENFYGATVTIVETVEESTPHLLGMLE